MNKLKYAYIQQATQDCFENRKITSCVRVDDAIPWKYM